MERKWWTLVAVCTAIFMLLLDITVVNVALPDIERSLGASFTDLQWVVDAYALALAALLLTAGSLADRFGRRRLFALGIAIFTVSSALCGLAGTPRVLDLARALQGVGGAMMFATSLALLAQEFHGRERGTAFGIWGATTGASVAIGPLIGGLLTDTLGWRWIFFVNVPIGIAAVALTLTRLAESRDPEASRLDWAGLVTFSGGLFCLVLALLRGNDDGWASAEILLLIGGGVALLVAFVVAERLQARPMFDLALFRKPAFTGAQIAAFAISASIFAMFLYITLYLQNVLGYTPLQAGVRVMPVTVLAFLVAPIAGKLSANAPVRALIGGGLVLIAIGLGLMSRIDSSSDWTGLLAGFVVAGAGIGLVNPPLASTAIAVAPRERSGMASGINSTFRQVGIATGIAALGAIFQHHVRTTVESSLVHTPAGGHAAQIATAVSTGAGRGAIASVPPQARATVASVARGAFVGGLTEIFLISAGVALVGGVLTLALVRRRDFVASAPQGAAGAAR